MSSLTGFAFSHVGKLPERELTGLASILETLRHVSPAQHPATRCFRRSASTVSEGDVVIEFRLGQPCDRIRGGPSSSTGGHWPVVEFSPSKAIPLSGTRSLRCDWPYAHAFDRIAQ